MPTGRGFAAWDAIRREGAQAEGEYRRRPYRGYIRAWEPGRLIRKKMMERGYSL